MVAPVKITRDVFETTLITVTVSTRGRKGYQGVYLGTYFGVPGTCPAG